MGTYLEIQLDDLLPVGHVVAVAMHALDVIRTARTIPHPIDHDVDPVLELDAVKPLELQEFPHERVPRANHLQFLDPREDLPVVDLACWHLGIRGRESGDQARNSREGLASTHTTQI